MNRYRTTLILNRRLRKKLKIEAARREITMKELVHEALEYYFKWGLKDDK